MCPVPRYEGTAVGPEGMPGEEVPEECGRQMGRALGHTERLHFYLKGSGELWGAVSGAVKCLLLHFIKLGRAAGDKSERSGWQR